MEKKFTKGEWRLRGEDPDNYAEIIGDIGTNKTIALVPKKCFVPQEEAEANAKLIAAAKTMYKKHHKNDKLCSQMIDLVKDNSAALKLLAKIKSNCCTAIQKATE